jgi:hypothetical protein
MDGIYAELSRTGTYVLALIIVIITYFVKKIAVLGYPKLKPKKAVAGEGKIITKAKTYDNKISMWWNEVGLQALPVVLGALFALSGSEYLFGEALTGEGSDIGDRVVYGAIVGWFSTFLYTVVRKTLLKKTGVDISPSGSMAPAPAPPPPKD